MKNDRGATSRTVTLLVAVLAIALVVVMYLWMQDRESQDLQIEIGSRAAPVQVAPA